MGSPIDEIDPGYDNEIFHGAGYEHLFRSGQVAHPGCDMHGHSADVVGHQFALASVKASPHLDSQGLGRFDDVLRTADTPGRTIEGGEKAVTDRFHLAPIEPI